MVTPPLWDARRTPRLGADHAGAIVDAEDVAEQRHVLHVLPDGDACGDVPILEGAAVPAGDGDPLARDRHDGARLDRIDGRAVLGPLRSVRSVGGPAKIVRGSPKLPRTGCGRSKGSTGQVYAYVVFTTAACAVDLERTVIPPPRASTTSASDRSVLRPLIAAPARRSR
jgi:hypothetical protein